jgi:hypothetical protein
MKALLVVLTSFSTAAQAHESVVPHTHPHGVSMLPGIDTIVYGLLVLAAALIAWKYRQRHE